MFRQLKMWKLQQGVNESVGRQLERLTEMCSLLKELVVAQDKEITTLKQQISELKKES